MAELELKERIDSRRFVTGERPSGELRYILTGTADDATARGYATANIPTSYDGLSLQSIDVEPLTVDEISDTGIWEISAKYGIIQPISIGGEGDFTFETGGGTQHVTQGIAPPRSYPPGPPDFGGAINVTKDSVDGVDIEVPVYNFSETHRIPDSTVTLGYRSTLFHMTKKVNNAPFKGLDAGECMFLGASGSRRGNEGWDITFRFAGSPNQSNLAVGTITNIEKKGWEYMWVLYEDDVAGNQLIKKPVKVFSHPMYHSGDFSLLGIGV